MTVLTHEPLLECFQIFLFILARPATRACSLGPRADATALDVIQRGTDRIVEVSDDEIAEAIRIIYNTTHNCAEGAGAAALAGLIKEREQLGGGRAAVVVSGQNIDCAWLQTVLAGGTPRVYCESKSESDLGIPSRKAFPLSVDTDAPAAIACCDLAATAISRIQRR